MSAPSPARDAASLTDVVDGDGRRYHSIALVGHVDVGKSTLLGHLMAKLGLVDQRLLHKFAKESAAMNKASYKYAWVLDTYDAERTRGITLDVSMHIFATATKYLAMLDCPGHYDLIPKVIQAGAQADTALLLIDACMHSFTSTFERGETKQQVVVLRSIGVTSIIVALNKIDKCEGPTEYTTIVDTVSTFLIRTGFAKDMIHFIPVSALQGDNLIDPGAIRTHAPWYDGPTLLQALDGLPVPRRNLVHPARVPIMDVFRSQTGSVCISGRLECGVLKVGDKVLAEPGHMSFTVKRLHTKEDADPAKESGDGTHAEKNNVARAGEHVEVTLHTSGEVVGLVPGLVLVASYEANSSVPRPSIGKTLQVQVLVLSGTPRPLMMGTAVMLHTHTLMVPARIVRAVNLLDRKTSRIVKEAPKCLRADELGVLLVRTEFSVCCEVADAVRSSLSRVLLRQENITVAVGIIKMVSE